MAAWSIYQNTLKILSNFAQAQLLANILFSQ